MVHLKVHLGFEVYQKDTTTHSVCTFARSGKSAGEQPMDVNCIFCDRSFLNFIVTHENDNVQKFAWSSYTTCTSIQGINQNINAHWTCPLIQNASSCIPNVLLLISPG